MRLITLFAILAVASAEAGQGLVLSPGQTLTFPVANVAPYTSLSSTRLEFRVHGWAIPSNLANLVSVPGFQIRFSSPAYNTQMIVTDWLDTFAPGVGNGLSLSIGAFSDTIVRVERDLVGGNLIAQAWSADGTGQMTTSSLPIASPGIDPLPDQGFIGDTTTVGVLDYVRWFSTTVPQSTLPFSASVGDLADFEFDGSLADSSPQNLILTPGSNTVATYANSPAYAPLATQGPQRIFNASLPQSLTAAGSTPLNGSTALTYQWSQISGPTQVQFDSYTTVSPNISGLGFGSYQIQLTVTDSSGGTSSNVVKYGSVFAGSNDVVVPPEPYITTILGPMLRLGASPWPYFDTSNQSMANFFGGLQSTAYLDVWNQAQPGTVSVVVGSTSVSGSGTSFQTTFCGGGTTPAYGSTIIIDYPVINSPGQFGRAPYSVASCQSNTALTLSVSYTNSASTANLSFAAMNNTSVGTWINGSSNANYYDNVMAFYSLYYRSGIDDYLTYAETLADRWYTMPWFDQGRASLNGATTLFPRMQSLTGLILRAFDGHPEYWNGIRLYLNYDFGFADVLPTAGYVLTDVREQGYATAFLALGALFDPLPGDQALYTSELESVISSVWAPALQPAGNWINTSFGYSTWNGNGGLAAVAKGSTVVTGTGTSWQTGWFTGNSFWTADPNGVTNGDAMAYQATVTSPTQLSLNVPYQGTSNSGRGWQTNSLVGTGTQPFMLGVAARAFNYAYLATGDARIPGFLYGIQSWIASQGYRPDARGLWYGRVFPNCEPISVNNAACSGGTVEASRFLSGEVIGGLSAATVLSGNASMAGFGDNLFGAIFGGPTGGPDADSTYVNDVAPSGWAMQNQLAKDFGFFYGFGGGPTWPAARLLAATAPPPSCSYSLSPNSVTFPSAGGTGTLGVSASAGTCKWTASSSVPWIVITSTPSGTGSASLTYAVSASSSASSQTGTITAAGQTFTVTQSGVVCSLSLGVTAGFFNSAGGAGSIAVTASAQTCPWTAVSNSSFITVTSGGSGAGNGAVAYSLTASTGSGVRTGTLTVAGQTFTVTEATPGGTDLDIGAPGLTGGASNLNGVYVVTGSGGLQIGNTADHFNFDSWQTTAKETLTARLTSLTSLNGSAKAGIMIRQSVNPSSPYMLAFGTSTQAGSQYRSNGQGGSIANGASVAATFPIWLRVTMANGVLTSYSSPDGKTWTMLGTPQTISLSTAPLSGLAVTSTNPLALSVATFDNVSMAQN